MEKCQDLVFLQKEQMFLPLDLELHKQIIEKGLLMHQLQYSKRILIFDDLNGQHLSWYQELENEGFTVSIINSVEDAAKDGNQPQLVILNSKLNGESSIRLIEKFKDLNTPIVICSKWGKDKMSFPVWASDLKVVKSGDYRDLKLTIQEILGQLKGVSNR